LNVPRQKLHFKPVYVPSTPPDSTLDEIASVASGKGVHLDSTWRYVYRLRRKSLTVGMETTSTLKGVKIVSLIKFDALP
jgi:hypothetical protein